MNNQTTLQEYRKLQEDIVKYETKREDEMLNPNTNKSDKRSKKVEEVKEEEKKEKVNKIIPKSHKDIKEKTKSSLVNNLKDPLTLKNFPLYQMRTGKIV